MAMNTSSGPMGACISFSPGNTEFTTKLTFPNMDSIPDIWAWRWDFYAPDRHPVSDMPSIDERSLLYFLLCPPDSKRTCNVDNLVKYEEPSLWGSIDLYLDDENVIEDTPRVTSLTLTVNYTFVPASPKECVLRVIVDVPTSSDAPFIQVDQTDLNKRNSSYGSFVRIYPCSKTVTLSASVVTAQHQFREWRRVKPVNTFNSSSVSVTIEALTVLRAVYEPRSSSSGPSMLTSEGFHGDINTPPFKVGPTPRQRTSQSEFHRPLTIPTDEKVAFFPSGVAINGIAPDFLNALALSPNITVKAGREERVIFKGDGTTISSLLQIPTEEAVAIFYSLPASHAVMSDCYCNRGNKCCCWSGKFWKTYVGMAMVTDHLLSLPKKVVPVATLPADAVVSVRLHTQQQYFPKSCPGGVTPGTYLQYPVWEFRVQC